MAGVCVRVCGGCVGVRMWRSAPFHPEMFISPVPKRRGNVLRSSLWLDEPTLKGVYSEVKWKYGKFARERKV